MSDVRRDAEILRDRCEELARQAEREMLDPSFAREQRTADQDRAKAIGK